MPIGEMPAKAQRAAAEFNGNERHIAPSLAGLKFRLRLWNRKHRSAVAQYGGVIIAIKFKSGTISDQT